MKSLAHLAKTTALAATFFINISQAEAGERSHSHNSLAVGSADITGDSPAQLFEYHIGKEANAILDTIGKPGDSSRMFEAVHQLHSGILNYEEAQRYESLIKGYFDDYFPSLLQKMQRAAGYAIANPEEKSAIAGNLHYQDDRFNEHAPTFGFDTNHWLKLGIEQGPEVFAQNFCAAVKGYEQELYNSIHFARVKQSIKNDKKHTTTCAPSF